MRASYIDHVNDDTPEILHFTFVLQQQVGKITEVADSVSYTTGSKMVFPVHYTIYNVCAVADYDQQANRKHDF